MFVRSNQLIWDLYLCWVTEEKKVLKKVNELLFWVQKNLFQQNVKPKVMSETSLLVLK
jgi:Txe/YoeB family toxin of Txe-Axe toxin-antitoxin module